MTDYVPRYHSFDLEVRPPSQRLPAGSCDSHFHVFGDPRRYPPAPGVEHVLPDATVEAMLAIHGKLGIERGLMVATTAYGTDHKVMLDALQAAGPSYRGCALGTVLLENDQAKIARLDAAGMHGARFGFLKEIGRGFPPSQVSRALDMCRELGWYAKLQPDYHVPLESIALFENTDVPVIIDHLGRAVPQEGTAGPRITKVLELLKRGNYWVLLSNAYKVSTLQSGWDDVIPIVRAYVETAPDRVLWATDWPHTFHDTPPPNDSDLTEFLIRATDATERQKILVDNPAALFDFH